MEPSVAVVIVNASAGPLLDRALDALERQTLRPARVLVVDNASRDGSVDGLEERHPGVEALRLERNVGFAAANNLGVGEAEGCEWVALLNPDAFPEPDWLEQLLRAAAEHPGFDVLASRLVDASDPARLDGTGDCYHVSGFAWRRDHGRPVEQGPSAPGEVFSACAAAALYRREAFLAVGGFDESFFCYFEDSDLAFRLRLAGGRCLYVPAAVVAHVGSASCGRESDFTVFHSSRNVVWTHVKNMPWPLLALTLPQHLLVNLLELVWYALRGRGRTALRAKAAALAGLPAVLRNRRAVQATRTVGSRELRALMATGPGAYVAAFSRARTLWRTGRASGALRTGHPSFK